MVRRLFLTAILCAAVSISAQPDRVRALLKSGDEHETAGRFEEAAHAYEEAYALAETTGDRVLAAEVLTARGYLRYYRGDVNEALTDLRRAYEMADAAGKREALANIAHIYADMRVAQYDRAIEYYRQLLPEYEAARDAVNVADTLYNLGTTYDTKGDPAASLEWFRRALAAEEKLGRRSEAAYVKRTMAISLGKLDRHAEALPLLDDALKVLVEMKEAERAMHVRQSRGIVLRRLGRTNAAIADLEASREWFAASKNLRFLEKSHDELALAYAMAGRWHDAYSARTAQGVLQRELAEKLREEHTSRMRVHFDAEKKEQENRALVRQNAAAVRIRRLQTLILILGAAALVALAFLAMRLRSTAMTDELTRLPNRRRMLQVAEQQLQRARTTGQPFTLIALDIDHFKQINDTWGHAVGDTVLRNVAQTCRTIAGTVGRIGGEEFLAVLPGTSLRDAEPIAERMRAAVEQLSFTELGPDRQVTISLGATEWVPTDKTLADLTRRADELLYRAKEGGRNRVEVAA